VDRKALFKQRIGVFQTAVQDVLIQRNPCFFAEGMGEIILAEVQRIGDSVQRKIAGKVFANVAVYIVHRQPGLYGTLLPLGLRRTGAYSDDKEAGIEDTPDAYYDEIYNMNNGENLNTSMLRTYVDKAGVAIDWLDEYVGVDFGDRHVDGGGYQQTSAPRVTYALGKSAAGVDSVFGRTQNLTALEEGPFYALYTVPWVLQSAGGVVINEQAQVVHENGNPIPGLYAVGELIGSANIDGHVTVGGFIHSMVVTFSLIAAESIAAL